MLADLSAACLWLLRREVRCLDRACAGVEEGAARREHAITRCAPRAAHRRPRGAAGRGRCPEGERAAAAHEYKPRAAGGMDQKIGDVRRPTPLANFREGC